MSCSCAGRSFWEGPCEWCTAHPKVREPLDYEEMHRQVRFAVRAAIDEVVCQAARELGYSAGLMVAGLPPEDYPGQGYFHLHNPNIRQAENRWKAAHES